MDTRLRKDGPLLRYESVVSALVIACLVVPTASAATASSGHNAVTPINHIVIITQENHSFDNYFGAFPGLAAGYGLNSTICEPLVPGNSSAGCLQPFDMDSYSGRAQQYDLNHGWNTSHIAYDNGKMDGFIYAQKLLPSEAGIANYSMGYYTSATLPDYWDYASYYALDANYFGSQLTYTYPNRLYEVAARSNFPTDPWTSSDPPLYNLTYATIIKQLSQDKISWGYYTGNWQDQWDCKPFNAGVLHGQHVYEGFNTFFGDLEDFPAIQQTQPLCNNLRSTTDLMAEINSGSLPAVAWVNPNMTQSEHPGKAATLPAGQLYVSSIINAIAHNLALWKHTAIFITYDEFGGYYDQVVPPQVDQWGYGFRLPLMVISPYIHPGIYYGSPRGQPEDLSAILSTIESNWGLSPLTSRDASDAPLWYMFNFHQRIIEPLIMPSNALGVYPWQTCVERGLCQIGTGLTPAQSSNPPSYRYPGVLSGAAVYNLTTDEDPGD